jgi:elongation factor Tu
MHHPSLGDKGPYGEEAILKLVDALDKFIALPQRDMDAPFLVRTNPFSS